MDYQELMKKGAIIIDVRSALEFAQGHAYDSINIPLPQIVNQIEKIKAQNKPIITCGQSGMSAESAARTLRKSGIQVYNAGNWHQVWYHHFKMGIDKMYPI